METVEELRGWVKASEKAYESVVGPIVSASEAATTKIQKANWRLKMKCYGEHLMDADTMDSAFLALASTGNYNPLTFIRSIRMTEAEIEAVNAIDSALSIFRDKTKAFNKEADFAIGEAKKRTGQLNDYMGRLSIAADKLNSVLSSSKMTQAIENAEKLVSALEILDVLEANGSLSRIMTAMAVKEGEI